MQQNKEKKAAAENSQCCWFRAKFMQKQYTTHTHIYIWQKC